MARMARICTYSGSYMYIYTYMYMYTMVTYGQLLIDLISRLVSYTSLVCGWYHADMYTPWRYPYFRGFYTLLHVHVHECTCSWDHASSLD